MSQSGPNQEAPTAATVNGRLSSELLEVRDQLRAAREEVRQQHDRGLSSVRVCARLTATADLAIQRVWMTALVDLPKADAAYLREHFALVAHGGYGRRHLSLHSDIDLMFLYDGPETDVIRQLAARLTKDICDLKLQLGQSLRTTDIALAKSREDAKVASSLIESRLLIGAQTLFEQYRTAFAKAIQRRKGAFCDSFVEARREEREKYGGSVFLLEPNVKRSRGALRDLHLLRWLWFAQSGESDLDRLRMNNVISKYDHHQLIAAREFYLKVRNDLHFEADDALDLLNRAEQVRLAEKLGYGASETARGKFLPVEHFMRDYFRHASNVWFLAARVSELVAPRPRVGSVLSAVFSRSIERDYKVDTREITATRVGRAKLETRLDEALRLVDLARLSGCRIHRDTWYHVYRSAPQYATHLEPATRDRFLDILENPHGLGQLLRRLHDLGVLDRVIPEFAKIRCLLQFNHYHKYTVDEHTIRAVEAATQFADRDDRLGQVYRGLSPAERRQLHLALLLHDIGKGRDEEHSEAGARIAREVGQRFELPEEDTEQLVYLVLRHLRLPHLAFRRDTTDRELLESVAEDVGTSGNLRLLYLLTCADLAGTGPAVLNDWKIGLLSDLHDRVQETLTPESRDKVQERRSAMRTAVWRQLETEQKNDSWFKRQFAALPPAFTATRSPSEVAEVLRRLDNFRKEATGKNSDAWGVFNESSSTLEFTAVAADGVGLGLFSRMAGALSAKRLRILAAETAVLDDDALLLRYVAEEMSGDVPNDERIAQVCAGMIATVGDETPPKFPRLWGEEQAVTRRALTSRPNEVRLDDQLSDRWLIVEVFTLDRLGLLYDLSRELHEMNLLIRFAKIATSIDRVVDVFYVSERDDTKPGGEHRLEEIRTRMMAAIERES